MWFCQLNRIFESVSLIGCMILHFGLLQISKICKIWSLKSVSSFRPHHYFISVGMCFTKLAWHCLTYCPSIKWYWASNPCVQAPVCFPRTPWWWLLCSARGEHSPEIVVTGPIFCYLVTNLLPAHLLIYLSQGWIDRPVPLRVPPRGQPRWVPRWQDTAACSCTARSCRMLIGCSLRFFQLEDWVVSVVTQGASQMIVTDVLFSWQVFQFVWSASG